MSCSLPKRKGECSLFTVPFFFYYLTLCHSSPFCILYLSSHYPVHVLWLSLTLFVLLFLLPRLSFFQSLLRNEFIHFVTLYLRWALSIISQAHKIFMFNNLLNLQKRELQNVVCAYFVHLFILRVRRFYCLQ